MKWIALLVQMLLPVGVFIYTINFGRWMRSRNIKAGAYVTYAIAVMALGLTFWVLLHNNV
ncbi:hypothetical protein [Effusibacillus consociatus]|uniref:Uncharacterized protein n=1 Tax=Effusibacillus consociatus TaxID=1117041 RepID=A0ABV9PZF3_9BACL